MATKWIGWVVVGALGCASPALAQEPAPTPAPRQIDRAELRHQIYVMEGALARAVEYGAQRLNRELRSVAPEAFLLAGDAQARGLHLEGYGVFFDVAVPMLRQSMMWSLRMMLQQDDATTKSAIAELRRFVQTESNPSARQSLETAIARLEAQATPLVAVNRPPPVDVPPGAPSSPGPFMPAGNVPASDAPMAAPTDTPWLMDTNRVYTEAVRRALIDAMLDFSAPMAIDDGEWLTVAARDNERRDTLAPQDPYEEVVTVLLRIKGADLREYRSGRIDKVEARKRVLVGEF
ncbi:MAG: hypothetical protein OEW19_02720 [Acidobacteriota bacterium]|nr:hypothetical protein [Acidobacteriota bacterium]